MNWITEEGWNDLLRNFADTSRLSEDAELEKELLWLYIPDWNKNGMMSEIESISKEDLDDDSPYWE